MSKTRSRSRSRARSRSSSPHTPRTPSDAFQVSDEDAMLIMPFDCNVIMSSGKSLHSFRCDQHTSMGCVRNGVRQILADMQNKGLLQEFDSFQLLRGEQICLNDYNKIYKVFANFESEDCVLTVVILRKSKTKEEVNGRSSDSDSSSAEQTRE